MNCSGKVCVLTHGCPENRIDGARIREFLKKNGHKLTSEVRDADIILLNACGLTRHSEKINRDLISRIEALKKPSAKVIMGGCLTKINSDFRQNLTFGVDDDLALLNTMFDARIPVQNIHANFLLPQVRLRDASAKTVETTRSVLRKLTRPRVIAGKLLRYYRTGCRVSGSRNGERTISKLSRERQESVGTVVNVYKPSTFLIKVSTGCLNTCSYCAVRLSRGRLKSKPIDRVVEEFEEGVAKGYRQFGLIGTDVGAYGRDRDTDLVTLLKELLRTDGDYRIKLRNIQPRFLIEMLPELRKILQSGKVTYLSSAAESGNNRILRLMNRGYRIEAFKEAIGLLNMDFPYIQLRTQLMVGFPSETEEEFQDTVRLLDELNFDVVEVYIFQSRPGTEAAKMAGQIHKKVALRRCYELCMSSERVIPYL